MCYGHGLGLYRRKKEKKKKRVHERKHVVEWSGGRGLGRWDGTGWDGGAVSENCVSLSFSWRCHVGVGKGPTNAPIKKQHSPKTKEKGLSGGMCSPFSTDLSLMGHSNLKAIQPYREIKTVLSLSWRGSLTCPSLVPFLFPLFLCRLPTPLSHTSCL